jgi:hypothetical protein
MAYTINQVITAPMSDYIGANAAVASAAAYAAAWSFAPDDSDLASRLLAAEAENRRLRQIVSDVRAILEQAIRV